MTALQTEVLTTDELVKIAHKQIDAFNNGDWEQMGGLLASDAQYHELGTERAIEGPEQIIEAFKGWKTAFPDATGTVTSSVASGDTAVLEVTWKGTQTGPLTTAAGTILCSQLDVPRFNTTSSRMECYARGTLLGGAVTVLPFAYIL